MVIRGFDSYYCYKIREKQMIILLLVIVLVLVILNTWLMIRVNNNDDDLNDLTKIVVELWKDNKKNK